MLARRIGGELSRLGNLAARGDNSCELSRAMAGGVISEKGITGGTGWAGVGLVRVRAFWCSCVVEKLDLGGLRDCARRCYA